MQTIQVAPQVPVIQNLQRANEVNVKTVRGLAITQLVIGILTAAFGIGVIGSLSGQTWAADSGGGIWGGIWIIVTGALGIFHSRNLGSGGLNGVYMVFSIISSIISFLVGIFFLVAVAFYASMSGCYWPYSYSYSSDDTSYGFCNLKFRSVGLGLHIPLLIMMVVEFCVSIVAAVYCCQNNSSCCGEQPTPGIIVQQPQPVYITTTGAPLGYLPLSNPQVYTAGQIPQAQMYPQQQPQVYPPGQVPQAYPGQVPMYQQQYQQYPMQTNVTYSQAPPPGYSQTVKN